MLYRKASYFILIANWSYNIVLWFLFISLSLEYTLVTIIQCRVQHTHVEKLIFYFTFVPDYYKKYSAATDLSVLGVRLASKFLGFFF